MLQYIYHLTVVCIKISAETLIVSDSGFVSPAEDANGKHADVEITDVSFYLCSHELSPLR